MTSTQEQRLDVKSVLVYWHCDCWWNLVHGASCPMEHDVPIYDYRERKGHKRRVWICNKGEGGIAYLSRKKFLDHNEEDCDANV